MMNVRLFAPLCCVLSLFTALLSGCGKSVDPEVLAARKNSLLESSPGKAIPIKDARSIAEDEKGEEFIITGRVGVRQLNEWWVDGSSIFWITEAGQEEADHGGPDHDPDTCPFCRRKWKQTVAVIQCVDDEKAAYSIDPRALFDLKEGDYVTVKGVGQLDETGILNVTTTGVYVQPGL